MAFFVSIQVETSQTLVSISFSEIKCKFQIVTIFSRHLRQLKLNQTQKFKKMKFQIKFTSAILTLLLLISCPILGQSKSKEDLGNALVESILTKNVDSFKFLLLPQEVVLKLNESDIPENTSEKERDSLMSQFKTSYEQSILPRHEKNFWDVVNLNENSSINWNELEFVVLYKYESKVPEYDPFLIHTNLIGPDYKHFYFSAVRYKGEWFLEDKMEITKDEKYAPRD